VALKGQDEGERMKYKNPHFIFHNSSFILTLAPPLAFCALFRAPMARSPGVQVYSEFEFFWLSVPIPVNEGGLPLFTLIGELSQGH